MWFASIAISSGSKGPTIVWVSGTAHFSGLISINGGLDLLCRRAETPSLGEQEEAAAGPAVDNATERRAYFAVQLGQVGLRRRQSCLQGMAVSFRRSQEINRPGGRLMHHREIVETGNERWTSLTAHSSQPIVPAGWLPRWVNSTPQGGSLSLSQGAKPRRPDTPKDNRKNLQPDTQKGTGWGCDPGSIFIAD